MSLRLNWGAGLFFIGTSPAITQSSRIAPKVMDYFISGHGIIFLLTLFIRVDSQALIYL